MAITWERPPVVVLGLGELGAVFARGFLRLGHPVFPVTRATRIDRAAERLADPELVLTCVGEADLDGVLERMPHAWKDRVGLVQNELLPRDWTRHGIVRPTVSIVWFEKKPGMDSKVLLPTVTHGPAATRVTESLQAIGIDATTVVGEEERTLELVAKNVYILTVNLAGLETRGRVGELWTRHRELANRVLTEVIDLQEALAARTLPRAELVGRFARAVEADPEHQCTGRSAKGRLARALSHATELSVDVPTLREIASHARAPDQ